MKKILLAIFNDFSRKTYAQLLREEKFEVFETNNGQTAFNLALKENPDLIVADVVLLEIGGLQLMRWLQQRSDTQKIPLLIFSQLEKDEERIEAMDGGAKDFIVGSITSPWEVIAKIKIHLGLQKTYRLLLEGKNVEIAKDLKKDLGYPSSLQCPRCRTQMELFLMRDLSKGKDYFKVSFTCPNCAYTE